MRACVRACILTCSSHALQTWNDYTPEFFFTIVLISSPFTLLVALWGMTTERMRQVAKTNSAANDGFVFAAFKVRVRLAALTCDSAVCFAVDGDEREAHGTDGQFEHVSVA